MKKHRQYQIERRFDSENDPKWDSREDAAYGQELAAMRRGVQAVAHRESIADPQFAAFMEGVWDGIERPKRSYKRLWAYMSLASAALIVAISTLVILNSGPQNVAATEVEEAATEIEGATVHWETAEDGSATVWVEIAEGDLW